MLELLADPRRLGHYGRAEVWNLIGKVLDQRR
jgi:hypothetical protein